MILRGSLLFWLVLPLLPLVIHCEQAGSKLGEGELSGLIDQAVAEVRIEAFDKAVSTMARLSMEARRRAGTGELKDLLGAPKPLLGREEIPAKLTELRRMFVAGENVSALQQSLQLGRSLSSLHAATTRHSMPISGQSGSPFQVSQKIVQAYAAKNFAEAQLEANRLLALRQNPAPHQLYDQPAHSAYTVLGLIALEDGDVEKAKLNLILSVKGMSDASFVGFIPNFQLAERLWQAGAKETVEQYVSLCKQVEFRHPRTREAIAGFDREIQAGTFAGFGNLARSLR